MSPSPQEGVTRGGPSPSDATDANRISANNDSNYVILKLAFIHGVVTRRVLVDRKFDMKLEFDKSVTVVVVLLGDVGAT